MNKNKKLLFLTAVIFSFVLFCYGYVSLAIKRPSQSEVKKAVSFEIPSGSGVYSVGRRLKELRLINSTGLFFLYVKVKGVVIEAGNYEIPTNLSVRDVVMLLSHGTNDIKITFVEGLRAEEIYETAEIKLQNLNFEEFMNEVNSKGLEGKLFPDTYYFLPKTATKELLGLLTKTFESKAYPEISGNRTNLSEADVLILASIVEREEPDSKERPTVAGILIDRLFSEEPLGADATTQYIFGKSGNWWPKNLSNEQLETENPYNTRKTKGLPPTPISNPGLSAISSVLNYKLSDYKFYLHGKDGKVHYAKTLAEHEENRRKFL